MVDFIKKARVELSNNHSELFINYDEELIDSLIKDDGWIEFIRITESGKNEHRLYAPINGPIICIKWEE